MSRSAFDPPVMAQSLDDALLEAHACHDGVRLARLYGEAAGLSEAMGAVDAACFYLTHAYVFALEAGLPSAADFNRRLAQHGRDELQHDLA